MLPPGVHHSMCSSCSGDLEAGPGLVFTNWHEPKPISRAEARPASGHLKLRPIVIPG